MSFLDRLKERALFQWAAAYAAGAWLTLEILSFLADTFVWSPTIVRGATIAFAVGLPLVVVLAWYHGEKGRQRVTGTEALIIAAILGTGGLLVALFAPAPEAMESPSRALLPSGEERRQSVAALPFSNLSMDPDNAFFADGVHESVVTRLSMISELRVLSTAAVMQFRDTDLTVAEIADQLGAGAVLRGSVQRVADQIRITVQLIDPMSEQNLWADEFDGTIGELFDIQSAVALRVAEELEAALSPAERDNVERPVTDDEEALDFYLRGRYTARSLTPEDTEEAIRLYRLAIAEDSTAAAVWAALGGLYVRRVRSYGYPPSVLDSALVMAEHAIELDPDLGDGYRLVGGVHFTRGRNAEATEWFLEALDRNPGDQSSTSSVGFAHLFTGRWDEALRFAKRAYAVDPTSAQMREMLANSYQDLLEFEIAERWLAEALERDPRSPLVRRQQQALAILRGEPEAGYRVFSEYVATSGEEGPYISTVAGNGAHYARDFDDALRWSTLALEQAQGGVLRDYQDMRITRAHALLRAGPDPAADSLLAAAEAGYRPPIDAGADSWVFPLYMAQINLVRGDVDTGLEWFEATERGGFNGWNLMEVDPIFDIVRDNPRYQAVIATMRERLESQRMAIETEERAAGER